METSTNKKPRPTSLPPPEKKTGLPLSKKGAKKNDGISQSPKFGKLLSKFPEKLTREEVGKPKQGAQSNVSIETLKSPGGSQIHTICKKGALPVKNEIAIYKAIASNFEFNKYKSSLSYPFYTNSNNLHNFFYSSLQENGSAEEYIHYIQEKLSNRLTSAYLFKQVTKLIELLCFLHNSTFIDEHGSFHRGIRHGDIKLDNILLDKNGNFLLTDFGCAQFTDEPIKYLGMLLCVSPEFHSATEYHMLFEDLGKSDIWSLGVMIVKLFTDKYPIQIETIQIEHADQLPGKQQKMHGYVKRETEASDSLHDFLSDNLCGQALRIEWGKSYISSALCRKAFQSKKIIDNLLKNSCPLSRLNTKDILLHLGFIMLLPFEIRSSAQELKNILEQLAPYFFCEKQAIVNFAKEMIATVRPNTFKSESSSPMLLSHPLPNLHLNIKN